MDESENVSAQLCHRGRPNAERDHQRRAIGSPCFTTREFAEHPCRVAFISHFGPVRPEPCNMLNPQSLNSHLTNSNGLCNNVTQGSVENVLGSPLPSSAIHRVSGHFASTHCPLLTTHFLAPFVFMFLRIRCRTRLQKWPFLFMYLQTARRQTPLF